MNANQEYSQGLPDAVAAHINAECYYVSRGVKPCTELSVQSEHEGGASGIAAAWGLLTHHHGGCLYLFRHEHLREVIEWLDTKNLPLSENVSHWINGKLFGYSDEAIAGFMPSRTQSRE